MPLAGILAVIALAICVYAIARRRDSATHVRSDAMPLPAPSVSWTARVGAESADAAARLAIVQRLGIVGTDWCIEVLEAALDDEPDGVVRDAIWRALLTASCENT